MGTVVVGGGWGLCHSCGQEGTNHPANPLEPCPPQAAPAEDAKAAQLRWLHRWSRSSPFPLGKVVNDLFPLFFHYLPGADSTTCTPGASPALPSFWPANHSPEAALMYQQKLCCFQHLNEKKVPITTQSSSKGVGKKEMGLMNNLSCPAEAYQRAPPAWPVLCLPARRAQLHTHTQPALRACLPVCWNTGGVYPALHGLAPGSSPCDCTNNQPKPKISEPSRWCVETSAGNGLSLKASGPFAT